jgi:hypothetical protein
MGERSIHHVQVALAQELPQVVPESLVAGMGRSRIFPPFVKIATSASRSGASLYTVIADCDGQRS